ncbi:MAG: glycosyltransferase family 4 protein [Clostridiales bacterium]|nr:glycosyltransferase family 4 protein [Clostridiales bacterium]
MDIWLINHYAVPAKYYPLARPTNFAKYLMQAGHTVTIFAASTVHNSDLNLITDGAAYIDDMVDGIHYVYIRCHSYRGNGAKRVLNMCEFARKLKGVCAKYPKPDAIVATSMPPMSCAAGIRLARKYGCRGVAEIADLWPESLIAYGIAGPKNPAVLYLRRMEKWIYTHADAVVFTMEGAYDYIAEQGWEKDVPRSKVYYINNGVDLEQFNYNKEHFKVTDVDLDNPDLFKVVYTGSIRKVNNLGLLLDAAKEVKDPRVKFLIWGDGDERPALEQHISDEQISNVVFKGRVEKKYIPSIVSRADLNFMHGTPNVLFRFGISPNKLFDYFAAQRPILMDFASEYNPAEQYECCIMGNGAQDIAKKIADFFQLPEEQRERMRKNCELAAKRYDFSRLTEELVAVMGGKSEQ